MANPPKPSSGDTKHAPQYEMEDVGHLDRHRVTDETDSAPSFSDKVPRQKLYQGAPWEHEVSIAWDKGGVVYVIWLIASYVLPGVSSPSLTNATLAENNLTALNLIKLSTDNKRFEDPEVQSALRRVFPDMSAFARQWDDVQYKPPADIQNFLAHVEQQYRAIENINIGKAAFVDQAKKEILDHLNELKRMGAHKLAGAWHEKCEALKKFPIEKDPVVLFKFYHSLVDQLNKLKSYNDSHIADIKNPLEDQIKSLEELKSTVEGEISRRLSEVKQKIASKMPAKTLRALADKENIKLSEGSFAEQALEFQTKIGEKKDEATRTYDKLRAESLRLVEEQKTLNEKKAGCLEKNSQLEKKKNEDIAKLNKKYEVLLENRKLELSQEIESLQSKIDLTIKANLKWRTEHLSFWSQELSEADKITYENMQKNVAEFEKDLRTKIGFRDHLLVPSLEKEKKLELAKIENQFNLEITNNQAELKKVEEDLEQNEAGRDKANMWTKSSSEIGRLEGVEKDFKKAWGNGLDTTEVKNNCNLFARLVFIEGAFQSYQRNLEADPNEWPKTYYQEAKDSFTPVLLSSLVSAGVHVDSNIYETTKSTISQVLLPNLDGTSVDRKGLEEFQ